MQESSVKKGIQTRKIIYEKVVEYIQKHGYSPTVREIGEMVGLKSTSSVYNHLLRMFDDGTFETDAPLGTPRAIRVPGYKFVKESADDR